MSDGNCRAARVSQRELWDPKLGAFRIGDLFYLVPGAYHSLKALQPGRTPVISCLSSSNGIAGYYEAGGSHSRELCGHRDEWRASNDAVPSICVRRRG